MTGQDVMEVAYLQKLVKQFQRFNKMSDFFFFLKPALIRSLYEIDLKPKLILINMEYV